MFLVEWVELYWELDFKSATLRSDLITFVEELAPHDRNKLKLLILRQANPIVKRRLSSASVIARKEHLKRESNHAVDERTQKEQSPVIHLQRTAQVMTSSAQHTQNRKSLASAISWLSPIDDNESRRSILFNFKSDDVARQLTLIEFHMFENVQAAEFQDNAWQSEEKHTRAPFFTAMVSYSNKVTAWIEHEIVNAHGTRQVTAIESAIRLAEKCREIHNFNALMEVFSALSQITITRLKSSWARVHPKLRASFEDLEQLLTPIGNFRRFREEIKSTLERDEGPSLPYVGTFLRDVLFANDGNPHNLFGSVKIVNWDKLHIVGNQINYFNKFKKIRFQFPVIVSLRDLLIALPSSYESDACQASN